MDYMWFEEMGLINIPEQKIVLHPPTKANSTGPVKNITS